MNSGLARSAPPGSAIALREVTRTFASRDGDHLALGPITIEAKPGEFLSIIGPSGCGKSTTMLIAAGLLAPSTGSVEVDGKPLKKPLTDVGIVFQDHLLLDFRTAIDNVMLQQQIRRLDRTAMLARTRELFTKLGLKKVEGRYPHQLSGGMRQRVSIARALVHEPSVLLMDEPFGALDAITRTQIRHDLEALWLEWRKTVLFITHSIEEAIGLSDRVLVMSQGPGRIVDEILIELPRPRPAHLGHYPEFVEYSDRIYGTFERLGILSGTTEE